MKNGVHNIGQDWKWNSVSIYSLKYSYTYLYIYNIYPNIYIYTMHSGLKLPRGEKSWLLHLPQQCRSDIQRVNKYRKHGNISHNKVINCC